jgi:hypothetical protein
MDIHAWWNCRIASIPYIEEEESLGSPTCSLVLGELRALSSPRTRELTTLPPTYTNALHLPPFSLILYPPAVIALSMYTMKPPPNYR